MSSTHDDSACTKVGPPRGPRGGATLQPARPGGLHRVLSCRRRPPPSQALARRAAGSSVARNAVRSRCAHTFCPQAAPCFTGPGRQGRNMVRATARGVIRVAAGRVSSERASTRPAPSPQAAQAALSHSAACRDCRLTRHRAGMRRTGRPTAYRQAAANSRPSISGAWGLGRGQGRTRSRLLEPRHVRKAALDKSSRWACVLCGF